MMKKLLLVEDNPDNRDLVFAFLDGLYDVRACADAFEALEVLNRGDYRPDLLVLDVSLPGMDGVQLLGKIRQHPQLATLPAIAMTSHAMKGDQERFLAAGFNGYISKPILDDAALVGPIEKLLGSHG